MNQDDPFFLSRPFSQETLQLVDDVLLAVAGRIWEQTRDMAPPGAVVPAVNWQSEQRWQSPLRQNLLRLADYVNGGYSTTKAEVERAMKQIQRTLFGNPLGNDALLPDDFHKTTLGKLFHQAYWQMVGRRGLMTPDEALKELGREDLSGILLAGSASGPGRFVEKPKTGKKQGSVILRTKKTR